MSGGFEALGLSPEILRAITDIGWNLPTDVQDESIPLILGGGDVMVAAETGSGKTAAFSLPLLQLVHESLSALEIEEKQKSESKNKEGWVMSNTDKDTMFTVLRNRCKGNSARWPGGRSNFGVRSGKHYFEVYIESDGLCRVGWSTQAGSYNLGTDQGGFGFGGTGMKSNNGQFDAYGEPFGVDDVIGCMIDLDRKQISFSKNGNFLGIAFNNFPTGNFGYFPTISLKSATVSVNFGEEKFRFPPRSDYKPICHAHPQQIIEGVTVTSSRSNRISQNRKPLALILEPSKDLACQVSECLNDFKKYFTSPTIQHTLLIGGMNPSDQITSLQQGSDVIIGTPGRIVDLVEKKILDLSQVRLFILDEADQLIEGEGLIALRQIYEALPKLGSGNNRLQVCFFSATLHSSAISNLSSEICQNPTWVDLKGKDSVPDTVHHVIIPIDPSGTDLMSLKDAKLLPTTDGVHKGGKGAGGKGRNLSKDELSENIKLIKPLKLVELIDKYEMEQCIIFCRTNLDCDNLEQFLISYGGGQKFVRKAEKLKENPYSCCVLAGMRSQAERQQNLQAFKDGEVRFLICTDAAARGIDIKKLPYIINMTLPQNAENYIHRIGRVGRADCMGLAISLVPLDHEEKVWFHQCPDRGKSCRNRELTTNGGCTIWYNEKQILDEIEAKLSHSIARLGCDLDLPENMRGVSYGQEVKIDNNVVNPHLQHIQPTLRELIDIEFIAQNNWLMSKSKFNFRK